MSRYYVLNDKHTLPQFVFVAVASWVFALGAMTIVGLIIWLVDATSQVDVLKAMPRSLNLVLGLCGAYAALGAICLYVTMWIYWIAVQRSPLTARIGWFLALLLGLHYGALFYACHVWFSNLRAMEGAQPIANS